MKKVTKVVVFYEDGTFEEVAGAKSFPSLPVPPNIFPNINPVVNWNSCKACGAVHGHGGLTCPTLIATTTYATSAT